MSELDAINAALRESNENLVHATLQAQALAERAEQMRHAQEQFIAMLGHELRNPLAPIRSAVSMLAYVPNAPELLETLCPMMERQLVHLTRILDDLLDIHRIREGKIILRLARVAFNHAILTAVEQVRPTISSNEQQLDLRLSPQPIFVTADAERLTQVAANLLNNATKYTARGGRIEVATEATSDYAVLRVRDNGRGIPGDKFDAIFELFNQLPADDERYIGGLGIGLALSRQLVEMHGGVIQVYSEGIGLGSEFVVRLPLDGPASAAAADTATVAPTATEPDPPPQPNSAEQY